ncbi:probable adenylate kinase 7, mitochondrial [Durio zibethinus]|uniref:adenylate kinase n=1 Tax=Durio zibethinus TaxID=66656 RepID=A0A6P5YH35_DURZI|nr:probable adenylate kinase 7, mitochondrial [Durio zibethinus]XP_022739749.1 probable adenylate kinase 7, mitochondrial [Durio zibethinus]
MARLPKLQVAAAASSSVLKSLRRGFRTFGSAAALELDCDYEYYEYEQAHRDRLPAQLKVDVDGSVPERGVQWVLIGEPGVKRHAYAERLSKLLEVPHISMGTLVRQELNPHSSLYKQIANAVNEGKLVPEDVIFALLFKRLEEGYCGGENGFILDGIPRTRMQAEILDQIADIGLVVNFKCTEDYMLKKSSESEFHHIGNSKDVGSSWKENVHRYSEQAKSVEDYYSKQKKLLNYQVAGASADAWQGLLAALRLQHMNALSSSQKLTA